ncbi:hypothetical protein DLAC_10287 [Tieghemostelium lacteum]|uniref:Uncharacterized protein n=1 Tax=Tieghemostelium lacteum TaxID=361077 RepID=A0A151Z542_TIELA|nr:hypothetical protein DLAC_10287 [Tieghemostelium lacteum]|eukprot:KYQ89061.1 hypothetical protein DLAC_10287 [Tieghemostelium lacteum]
MTNRSMLPKLLVKRIFQLYLDSFNSCSGNTLFYKYFIYSLSLCKESLDIISKLQYGDIYIHSFQLDLEFVYRLFIKGYRFQSITINESEVINIEMLSPRLNEKALHLIQMYNQSNEDIDKYDFELQQDLLGTLHQSHYFFDTHSDNQKSLKERLDLIQLHCTPGKSIDSLKVSIDEMNSKDIPSIVSTNKTRDLYLIFTQKQPLSQNVHLAPMITLKKLKLKYGSISIQDYKNIFEFCPMLEWLSIRHTVLINDEVNSILESTPEHLNLTKLTILLDSGIQESVPRICQFLNRNRVLQSLKIYAACDEFYDGPKILIDNQSLTELKLIHNYDMGDYQFRMYDILQCWDGKSSLKLYEITESSEEPFLDFDLIKSHFTGLTTLGMSVSTQEHVTETSVLVNMLPLLTVLKYRVLQWLMADDRMEFDNSSLCTSISNHKSISEVLVYSDTKLCGFLNGLLQIDNKILTKVHILDVYRFEVISESILNTKIPNLVIQQEELPVTPILVEDMFFFYILFNREYPFETFQFLTRYFATADFIHQVSNRFKNYYQSVNEHSLMLPHQITLTYSKKVKTHDIWRDVKGIL